MPQMCFTQLILHIRVVFHLAIDPFLTVSLHHNCIIYFIAETVYFVF